MLRMTPLTGEGQPLDNAARLAELTGFVSDAARDGLPAHELERGLWHYWLRLGVMFLTWIWISTKHLQHIDYKVS